MTQDDSKEPSAVEALPKFIMDRLAKEKGPAFARWAASPSPVAPPAVLGWRV